MDVSPSPLYRGQKRVDPVMKSSPPALETTTPKGNPPRKFSNDSGRSSSPQGTPSCNPIGESMRSTTPTTTPPRKLSCGSVRELAAVLDQRSAVTTTLPQKTVGRLSPVLHSEPLFPTYRKDLAARFNQSTDGGRDLFYVCGDSDMSMPEQARGVSPVANTEEGPSNFTVHIRSHIKRKISGRDQLTIDTHTKQQNQQQIQQQGQQYIEEESSFSPMDEFGPLLPSVSIHEKHRKEHMTQYADQATQYSPNSVEPEHRLNERLQQQNTQHNLSNMPPSASYPEDETNGYEYAAWQDNGSEEKLSRDFFSATELSSAKSRNIVSSHESSKNYVVHDRDTSNESSKNYVVHTNGPSTEPSRNNVVHTHDESESQIRMLEQQVHKLQTQLALQRKSADNKTASLEHNIEMQRGRERTLVQNLEEERRASMTLEERNLILQKQLVNQPKSAKTEIAAVHNDLAREKAQVVALNYGLNEERRRAETLEYNLQNEKHKVASLVKRWEEEQTAHQDLQKQNQTLRIQLAERQVSPNKELDALKQDLEKEKARVLTLTHELDEERKKKKSLEIQLEIELEKETARVDMMIRSVDEERRTHAEERKQLADQLESAAKKTTLLKVALKKERAQVESLRSGLDEERRNTADVQQQLSSRQKCSDKKNVSLLHELENEKARVNALTGGLDGERKRSGELRKEVKALNSRLRKTQEALLRTKDAYQSGKIERETLKDALFHAWGKHEVGPVEIKNADGTTKRGMGYQYKFC